MSDSIAPTPVRSQVVPPELPGVSSLLTLVASVVAVAALFLARDVLIPVTLAGLLSFLLAPLASLLRRLHIPRAASVLLTVFLALGLILGIGTVIEQQLAELASQAPGYETTLDAKVTTLRRSTLGQMESLMRQVGKQFDPQAQTPTPRVQHAPPAGSQANPLTVQIQSPPASAMDLVQRVLGQVLAPVGTILLVLIVAVFILLQKEDLRDRLIRLFGSNDLHRTTLAMNDAAARLSKYFLTQLAINACFGVIVSVGLFFIGVPSPVLWGLVGTLARFVPYAGVFIAGGIPLLLAASVDPTWGTALWTLGLYLVTEPIMGQVIEPIAYGHSTGLSPVSVVIAAIFWTWIWGPIGLLLATPLTLCLVVLGRHVKRLEFLDVLLGDRPALTPVESLYQRLLAGDPDEAATQAELLLRDRPLSSYYDEVALRSLLLAAADVVRGVLSRDRQILMRDAITGLIDDLDDHEDAAPSKREDGPAGMAPSDRTLGRSLPVLRMAPARGALSPEWQGVAPILCLGGRGPLDDAAASMLAQLLGKHGLPARMADHEAATRSTIGALDVSGVMVTLVSYMEETGSPAHLRVLMRRLRQRMPDAQLVLCLWQGEVAPERDLQAEASPDAVAGSLREAVAICVEAAEQAAAEPLETRRDDRDRRPNHDAGPAAATAVSAS